MNHYSEQSNKSYVLGVGEAGAKRLQLLHRIYGPGSERLLIDIGLASGMHAADIGCGVGTVSVWMARHVGETGSVVCVDNSPEQLSLARRAAHENGLGNITFIETNADRLNLPPNSLDVIYCRFLLDHLPDPQAAIQEMRGLLRPQGTLVTETIDLSGIATDPPNPAYADEIRHMNELNARRGIDGAGGLKVHRWFRAAGFREIEVRLNQPAYLYGEEKRFWEYSIAESATPFVSRGFSTAEEMRRRILAMQTANLDENTLVALPRCVQVWARK